jgi:hypothetical protein
MREKIVCQQCWFKENLEKYDEEYDGDFSACLFRLFKKVPYRSRLIANMENSEYCNQETDDRDCYLNTG